MEVLIYKPKRGFNTLKYAVEDVVDFRLSEGAYEKNYFILIKVDGELDHGLVLPLRSEDGSLLYRRGFRFDPSKLKLKLYLKYFVKREIEISKKVFMDCIRSKK